MINYQKGNNMKLRHLLGVYSLITFSSLTLYVTLQQALRLEADDDPSSRAQSTAALLSTGVDPAQFAPPHTTDLSTDSSFLLIADQSGRTVISTANIGGKLPTIPQGVYEYTAVHGSHHVTWAPAKSIRLATVVVPYRTPDSAGFVASGVSLTDTERLVAHLGIIIGSGWIGSMIIASFFFYPRKNPKS